jgi:hypothetical protein
MFFMQGQFVDIIWFGLTVEEFQEKVSSGLP